MNSEAPEDIFHFHENQTVATLRQSYRSEAERIDLLDLIQVLMLHPGGLRRWSVMRAIRSLRENRRVEISPKIEDEIERVFRKFCAGEPLPKGVKGRRVPEDVLFHRPKEKAGEVWAVNPHPARAWLKAEAGVQYDAR